MRGMRQCALFAAIALGACGGGAPTASLEAGADAADEGAPPSADGGGDSGSDARDATRPTGPRVNEVVAKSAHNAYERAEPLVDQLVFHRIRSVELDIHVGKTLRPPLTGDWYVYHADIPGLGGTSCDKLSDCLRELRAFHDLVPQHELVTVLVDLKDDFRAGQSADDLDAAIGAKLPQSALLRPADLRAACPAARSLREAVTGACAWPELVAVRGKFAFLLTGGSACAGGGVLDGYVGGGTKADTRTGFIVPSIDDTCTFAAYAGAGHVVFFNMDWGHRASAKDVRAAGLVGRLYYGGLTGGLRQQDWAEALGGGAHLLATDDVNYQVSPWSATHQPNGWPFTCSPACASPQGPEPGRTTGVDVVSGDIEGNADGFFFERDAVSGDATWTAAISVASSHVEEWAKGCLMARAQATAGSPYFAVCRPADKHPLRVQYRTTAGGGTTVVEMAGQSGRSDETPAFARLTVTGNQVKGEGSVDGKVWVTIAQATFGASLGLQGLAASGHGSASPVRFLFAEAKRVDGSGTTEVSSASLSQKGCVGSCTSGVVFDAPVR